MAHSPSLGFRPTCPASQPEDPEPDEPRTLLDGSIECVPVPAGGSGLCVLGPTPLLPTSAAACLTSSASLAHIPVPPFPPPPTGLPRRCDLEAWCRTPNDDLEAIHETWGRESSWVSLPADLWEEADWCLLPSPQQSLSA